VPTLLAAFPTMHSAWGLGFVRGIVGKLGARDDPRPGDQGVSQEANGAT
jgi:hypothetical protein